jgi:hypothetical protein
MLQTASRLSADGHPIPDPLSPAVADLAPDSPHMEEVNGQDVLFGTRVLALGITNDFVVPADRTAVPQDQHRILGPEGLMGHSAIVTSAQARGIAYDFLRGAAPSCPDSWDTWGRHVGRAIGFTEARLGDAYRIGEFLGGRHPFGK